MKLGDRNCVGVYRGYESCTTHLRSLVIADNRRPDVELQGAILIQYLTDARKLLLDTETAAGPHDCDTSIGSKAGEYGGSLAAGILALGCKESHQSYRDLTLELDALM